MYLNVVVSTQPTLRMAERECVDGTFTWLISKMGTDLFYLAQ